MPRYITEIIKPTDIQVFNFTGDGSTTAFTIGGLGYEVNKVQVFINGVHQDPSSDYTIAGTSVNISPAVDSGDKIVIIEFPI